MEKLFRLSGAVKHEWAIEEWLASEPRNLFAIAHDWFQRLRACGDDVRELMHDGCPVVCVGDAAFAYVNVFSTHVNVGFFTGAMLDDPQRLLEGSGKRMRHVRLRPDEPIDSQAVLELIIHAYEDVKRRRVESYDLAHP